MADPFSIMPIQAFQDDRLTKTDLRVLGAILSWADKDRNAHPTRDQIAARCNLPLCKISTSTTHLVELGWLKKNGTGGHSKASDYQVIIPNLSQTTVTELVTVNNEKVTDLVTVTETGTVTELVTGTVTELVTFTLTESVRGILQTNTDQVQTTISVKSKIESLFEEFWAAYPRKVSKEPAFKAFAKLKPDEQLASEIQAGLLRAKTLDSRFLDRGFIPHAATWLNAKGWRDEFDAQTAYSRNQPARIGERGAQETARPVLMETWG